MPTLFKRAVVVAKVSKPEAPLATFNDDTSRPTNAAFFICDVADGWRGTSELNAIFQPMGTSDGAVASDFFARLARQITLAGSVEGNTPDDSDDLEDFVIAAFPRNTDLILTIHDPTPKWVRILVSGKLEIVKNTPTGFRWTVPVTAVDPLKYALSPFVGTTGISGVSTGGFTVPFSFPLIFTTITGTFSSAVVMNNIGTGNSPPLINVYGPLDRGWRLVNDTTGELIAADMSLITGDNLELDFSRRTLKLNGFSVLAALIGDFWKLVPGVNEIRIYANYNSVAGFKLTAYSAWE